MANRYLTLSDNKFNPVGYWEEPIGKTIFLPTLDDVALFDQNGYDLTELEKHFASTNIAGIDSHRSHRTALKQDWFTQSSSVIEGPLLNHGLLFERKGYRGKALEQLQYWAQEFPFIYKIIAIKPKWGLDFSMDYADAQGNVCELLHWEWDSFDYEEIQAVKEHVEPKLLSIDWQDVANELLKRKSEWYDLDFFAQSDWKCNFFGIQKEQFKMVIWK